MEIKDVAAMMVSFLYFFRYKVRGFSLSLSSYSCLGFFLMSFKVKHRAMSPSMASCSLDVLWAPSSPSSSMVSKLAVLDVLLECAEANFGVMGLDVVGVVEDDVVVGVMVVPFESSAASSEQGVVGRLPL